MIEAANWGGAYLAGLGHIRPSWISCVTASQPSSPDSQPTALDLRGSQGITLLSVSPHFRHSKVRRSKPSGPADTFAVIIRVLHLRQRGRAIGKSSGSGLTVPMAAPLGSVCDAEILGERLKNRLSGSRQMAGIKFRNRNGTFSKFRQLI